jgi:hypothetical protein
MLQAHGLERSQHLDRYSTATNPQPQVLSFQSIDNFLSRTKSDSILPAPGATEFKGSSAIATGKPVSSRNRLSRFLSSDPPPVGRCPPAK